MLKKFVFAAACFTMYIVFSEGCVYHKGDEQYPSTDSTGGGNDCDTTNVRYSVEIKAILDESCKSCHKGSNSISGVNLYDYETISFYALDGEFTYGTLLSAVMHKGGAPEMPDGGPKLQDCDINKIAAWVNNGAPDN